MPAPTLRSLGATALLTTTLLTPVPAALAAGSPPPPAITSLNATHPHKFFQETSGTSGAWIYYGHDHHDDHERGHKKHD
ncbi:hypothetical protein [Streptomyces sp. NPDC002082]|uniref:hypothetical protein n=1 Tax=Streptomyces sp. NPDC002082 TaxID=3154772 RepID=UPI00332EF0FD